MGIKEHKFQLCRQMITNRKQMIDHRRHHVIDRGLKLFFDAKTHLFHSDSSEVEPSNVNDFEETSELKTWSKKTILVASDLLFIQMDEILTNFGV